ncbi:MAG: hypothetical protein ACXV2D_08035 [Halobacteriota archaeon]
MHKRIIAIALCLVMVSTVAATGAVSATTIGKSNIRTFDVYWVNGSPVGKATLNLDTGHFVVNVNMNKIHGSNPWPWWEGQPYYLEMWSPSGDWNSMWNANDQLITITLTADGTATLDTYLAPWSVTDPGFLTYYWNDPGTGMWF